MFYINLPFYYVDPTSMRSFCRVWLTYTLTVVAGSYLTVISVDVVAGPSRLVFLRFTWS